MGMKKLSDITAATKTYIDTKASLNGATFTGPVTMNAKLIASNGFVTTVGTDKFAT